MPASCPGLVPVWGFGLVPAVRPSDPVPLSASDPESVTDSGPGPSSCVSLVIDQGSGRFVHAKVGPSYPFM